MIWSLTKDIATTLRVLRVVFRGKLSYSIVLGTTIFVPSFVLFVSNVELLLAFLSGNAPVSSKFFFVLTLYQDLVTSFGLYSFLTMSIISILFGVHISLIVFFLAKTGTFSKKSFALNIPALISGLLGVGCAACGALLPIFPSPQSRILARPCTRRRSRKMA